MQPGGFSVVNNYAPRGADFNIPVASADDEIKAIKINCILQMGQILLKFQVISVKNSCR